MTWILEAEVFFLRVFEAETAYRLLVQEEALQTHGALSLDRLRWQLVKDCLCDRYCTGPPCPFKDSYVSGDPYQFNGACI